jgi:hypothetical protein
MSTTCLASFSSCGFTVRGTIASSSIWSIVRISAAWCSVHHQAVLLRGDRHQILAPVERDLADAHLPAHARASRA